MVVAHADLHSGGWLLLAGLAKHYRRTKPNDCLTRLVVVDKSRHVICSTEQKRAMLQRYMPKLQLSLG